MFQKYAVAIASVALLAGTGAERVDARGGGGGHGGGGSHGGGGGRGGGGFGGAAHFGGGFGGGYGRGYGYGGYGRGYGYGGYGRGFYGYPYGFGLGLGLGYGLGYGYGGYGYGGYGYGGYGYGGYGYGDPYGYGVYSGYGSPYSAGYGSPYNSGYGGYAYPPGGYGPSPYAPQAPLPDDGTYPYNGDPPNIPPLPAPAPRQTPANPAPVKGLMVSQPGSITYTAYGEEPQVITKTLANARSTAQPASTTQPRSVRVVYPAYGEQAADAMVLTQSKRD